MHFYFHSCILQSVLYIYDKIYFPMSWEERHKPARTKVGRKKI